MFLSTVFKRRVEDHLFETCRVPKDCAVIWQGDVNQYIYVVKTGRVHLIIDAA
jgi:hypothetical protein